MSRPLLPKGFIDHRGSYVVKGKRTHQDFLSSEGVQEWKDALNALFGNADKFEKRVIAKELAKLERKC